MAWTEPLPCRFCDGEVIFNEAELRWSFENEDNEDWDGFSYLTTDTKL